MRRFPHKLDHKIAGTINMGRCYPCDIFEVFPGESFKIQAENLTRLMPQISPTMTEVNLGIEFYQVPWRQLFDKLGLDWDAYLTGGEDGNDTTVLPTITIPSTGYDEGSLADWLNYPCNYTDPQTGTKVIVGAGLQLNALPVVAYMHIINENYRDQNFIAKLDLTQYQAFLDGTYVFTDPAGNTISYPMLVNGIFRKAWSRDYYGRSMSNTQRGPAVRVPLLGNAPVKGTGKALGLTTGTGWYGLQAGANSSGTANNQYLLTASNANYNKAVGTAADTTLANQPSSKALGVTQTGSESGMVADLSGVTAIDIITFRLAARMQRFGEILQKGGARAVEFTFNMFGVKIPDARIQRPIFHGSFKLPVIFSEVLQTSQTTTGSGASPQGNLAGHGITGGRNEPIHIKVIEHGYVMAIMHCMPRPQYQNIVPKYLLRDTRWSLPNPLFSYIGDQATLRKEIYPNSSNPNAVFGYVPRYTELSFIPSTIHGQMKGALLHWTMCRVFGSEPNLSAEFRYAEPSNRSFAVQTLTVGGTTITADEMQVSVGFHVKARRMFPRNPQPGIHIV